MLPDENLELEKLEITRKSHLRAFAHFPSALSRDLPHWIPSLQMLHRQTIDPRKNPFLKETPHHFFLIKKKGKTVGRFALFGPGQWAGQPAAGSFGWADFREEAGAFCAKQILAQAEKRGIKKIYGPLNPNLHHDLGIQTAGFDSTNSFLMNWNPPYYERFFKEAGFAEEKTFQTWELWKESYRPSQFLKSVNQRITKNTKLKIRPADIGNFEQELRLFHQLYSESFATHWGFQKPSWEEFRFLAADLKHLLKAEMALVAEWRGRPVGFVLAVPNLNELLSKTTRESARLFRLLGWKLGISKLKTVRVMIMGILPEARRLGIHAALFQQIAENIFALGYHGGEIAWVMRGNRSVEKTLQEMGAKIQKEYTLFSYDFRP